jgi:hypothetical protein
MCAMPGAVLKLTDGKALAYKREPYFSRTYGHFSGHKNTPYNNDDKGTPAIVQKGNVVYCTSPLPSIYKKLGSLYHKRYILQALRAVYHAEPIQTYFGAQGTLSVIKQPQHNRYCVNLLYGSPVLRGTATVIEDLNPVYNIALTFNLPEAIKRVYSPLTGEELPINGNTVILPKLECHDTLVLEY